MQINKKLLCASSILFSLSYSNANETEKPNVLFLVIEDTSPYVFPAYGNKTIKTPNIDNLAKKGLTFDNAFANAPQCSPVRSTLISGTNATTFGNDVHREAHYQEQHYFLPKILKDAGYFTVNAGKGDYNTNEATRKYMKNAWNLMSGEGIGKWKNASYNDSTRDGRPFFAQFNNMATHMSRLTTITLDARAECDVDADSVDLPPHVPDIPAMRADYALHMEGVQDIDEWVGVFIEDLKNRKLADNTIIFFFSDHGGCLPRGKAFPFDTGHRVPLIVYAPKKYEHLLPGKPGTRTSRLVSFDDFIPTVLSLAGIKPPEGITGKPFMGTYEEEPRKYVNMFRCNTEHHFDPSRSVFDGRYHYIRYYTPYKIHALTQGFQWQMPSQMAWDDHFIKGKCTPEHQRYYQPHPVEALYDLQTDPWEANNLAKNKEYKDKLAELRQENSRFARESRDLGFLSREDRIQMTRDSIVYQTWAKETNYPVEELISAAEKASDGKIESLPDFIEYMKSDKPSFRFWGIAGCAHLAKQGLLTTIPEEVYLLTTDEYSDVAATAAETLVLAGEKEKGLQILLELFKPLAPAASSLEELWEEARPLTEDFYRLANESENVKMKFIARSMLIKLGEMEIDQLYQDPKNIKRRLGTANHRKKYHIRTRP